LYVIHWHLSLGTSMTVPWSVTLFSAECRLADTVSVSPSWRQCLCIASLSERMKCCGSDAPFGNVTSGVLQCWRWRHEMLECRSCTSSHSVSVWTQHHRSRSQEPIWRTETCTNCCNLELSDFRIRPGWKTSLFTDTACLDLYRCNAEAEEIATRTDNYGVVRCQKRPGHTYRRYPMVTICVCL